MDGPSQVGQLQAPPPNCKLRPFSCTMPPSSTYLYFARRKNNNGPAIFSIDFSLRRRRPIVTMMRSRSTSGRDKFRVAMEFQDGRASFLLFIRRPLAVVSMISREVRCEASRPPPPPGWPLSCIGITAGHRFIPSPSSSSPG